MSRRKLTDMERKDWERLAETVRPLQRQHKATAKALPRQDAAQPPKAEKPRVEKPVRPPGPAKPAPPAVPLAVALPAAHAPGLDQFGMRQLRRAQGPDARIDLHGLRQTEAHHRLLAFLRHAQETGSRVVLIITGKGRDVGDTGEWWSEGERGVLRRAVPAWLATPPFRHLVAGFQPAARGHGGEGAFYVQLRSRKRAGQGKP
ncbi:MAG: Smr/MutS family protein [Rhodobiaceae bacterium]|nr:Smr/MutS family protein [Rhodobiaceae bacterium]